MQRLQERLESLDDPDRPPSEGLYFDRDSADRVCVFFSSWLKHSKGEFAGKPFELSLWQRHIVRGIFGWKRSEDNLRHYRELSLWIPKANGKSTLAAGLALYMAFMDGEKAAEVHIVANDQQQAGIVFEEARRMVSTNKVLSENTRVLNSARYKSVYNAETHSALIAVTSVSKTKDGLNSHCVIFDEIHEFSNSPRVRDLWAKMHNSVSKRRQPLIIRISTAGRDRTGIGYEEYLKDKRILKGASKVDNRMVVIFEADESDDWTSEETWIKANPAFGSSVRPETLRSELKRAKEDPRAEADFRRYYLNQWVSDYTGWVPLAAWDKCIGTVDEEKLAGAPCYIGFDMSKTTDFTAIVVQWKMGGTYFQREHYVLPGDGMKRRQSHDGVPYDAWVRGGFIRLSDGPVIDVSEAERMLIDLCEKHRPVEICYDRWGSRVLMEKVSGHTGVPCVDIDQRMTFDMSRTTAEFKRAVLSGNFVHEGNPVTRWMLECVKVYADQNGNERPVKRSSNGHIDGVMATINAMVRSSVSDGGPSYFESAPLVVLGE